MNGLMAVMLSTLLSTALFLYYRSRGQFALRGFVAINMILVLLFGSKLIDIGGYQTNLGSVWYTFVLGSQAHLVYHYNREAAVASAFRTLVTLACILALAFTCGLAYTVPGNEGASAAISSITSSSITLVPAMLFAFAIGQTLLLETMRWLSRVPGVFRVGVALSVAQIADSIAFYPAAFSRLPNMHDIFSAGLGIKVLISLVLTPFIVAGTSRFDAFRIRKIRRYVHSRWGSRNASSTH